MAQDYNSGLPVRSEADGADERLHVKVVDSNNPSTQQMTVDSDSNAHVEIHGNDEANVDRVVATNEKGNIALDGDYDVTLNTNPSSSGLIAHDRNATPTRIHQNKRVTAIAGESNTVCIDVALHDEAGQNYDANNPLPVAIEESEGDEIHAFEESEDIAKNASTEHEYVVVDTKTFLLHQVLASGSGKIKVEIQIGDGAFSEAFVPKAIRFNSTANPQADTDFLVPMSIMGTVDGTTIKVILTNKDNQEQDLHSTIVGVLRDTII